MQFTHCKLKAMPFNKTPRNYGLMYNDSIQCLQSQYSLTLLQRKDLFRIFAQNLFLSASKICFEEQMPSIIFMIIKEILPLFLYLRDILY